MQTIAPSVTVQPASEPLTLKDAKKHLNLSTSDTSHNEQLDRIIVAAREQWEHDTETSCCTKTYVLKTECFEDCYKLPYRPVQSITSIQYYDSNNTLTTLPTTVWAFDQARHEIRLKYNQTIPIWTPRYDAWTITYVAGYGSDGNSVPMIARQAMLLLVGYYFDANRGENDKPNDNRAYMALVNRFMRSSYP